MRWKETHSHHTHQMAQSNEDKANANTFWGMLLGLQADQVGHDPSLWFALSSQAVQKVRSTSAKYGLLLSTGHVAVRGSGARAPSYVEGLVDLGAGSAAAGRGAQWYVMLP